MTLLVVEVAALLGLAVVGWVIAGPARGGAWRALVSLPLGIAAVAVVELLLLVTRSSLAHPWVALGLTLVAAAGLAVRRRRAAGDQLDADVSPPWPLPMGRAAGIGAVVLLAVAAVTAVLPLVNLTADSFRFIPSAHALATEGDLADVSLHLLATRNLVVPLIHGLAVPEFGYLRAIGPLLGLVTLGLLWWLVQDGTRRLGGGLPWMLGAGAAALLATSSRFVFSTFYLNSHVLFACWLLLLVALVRSMLLHPGAPTGARDAWLIGLLGAGLALLRAEGALLATIAIAPLVLDAAVPRRRRQVVLVVLGVVVAAWQFGILLPRVLVDPGQTGNSVVGLGLFGLALIGVAPLLGLLLPRIPRPLVLVHVTVWLGTIGLGLRELELVKDSVRATWTNVTGEGLWGGSLLVLAALLVLALALRRVPAEPALVFPLVTFVPLALLLAILRGHAYRIGPGDSLNRMLVHLVPVVILVIALSAAGETRRPARDQSG